MKHQYNPHCKCYACSAYELYLVDMAKKQKAQPYYHPTIPQTPLAMKAFKQAIVFDPPPSR